MKNLATRLRQAAGVILIIVLALTLFLLFRLTLPASAPPAAYPPPGETPTPTLTPTTTGQPYPLPGGKSVPEPPSPTPLPTPTPTATPWKLTNLPKLKAYPTPGPFREMRILYVGDKQPGFWVTNLSSSEKLLWPTWPEDQRGGMPSHMLRVSPDGSQILYSLWFYGPGFDLSDLKRDSIWVMNPDGSGKRKLVGASEGWYPTEAIWSPDGKQIAFLGASLDPVSLVPIARELWVMNADGSQPQRVLSDGELFESRIGVPTLFFRWMGNGYIYFASQSLYAINPQDGSLYRLLDGMDALYLRFALSPDGQRAWGFTELPVESLRAAGFQVVELPDQYGMVWSTDGNRLAYVAGNAGGVWLRELGSGEERQLLPYTPGEYIRLQAFSPDNRYLAYQTDAGIYVLDLKTEHLIPKMVTADPHRDGMGPSLRFLAWIPVP